MPVEEPLDREVDVLRRAIELLQKRLPPGWSSTTTEQVAIAGYQVDALVQVTGPDGKSALFAVEARRVLAPRDLGTLVERLRSILVPDYPSFYPLVIARYLSASAQAWLAERNVSYIDATGNMRVTLESPGLYLRDVGASGDPWRGPGRPRGTLHGPPAAKVVRALADFRPPISMLDLIDFSKASTGATYRVVEFLEQEDLVLRSPRGPITEIAWRKLLERWSKDYSFQRNNTVYKYLQPRGMTSLLKRLEGVTDTRYVVTGSLAAHQWAPYAPAHLGLLYVDNPKLLADAADLRPVDAGANTLLATGDYDVVFQRAKMFDGVTMAAPSQVAVDLLTSPGRGPAEAEYLLDWMEHHEHQWRRRSPQSRP